MAMKAITKKIVSLLVMFFVPYLNESIKIIKLKMVVIKSVKTAKPPLPYQIPKVAVPTVIVQINQVYAWG